MKKINGNSLFGSCSDGNKSIKVQGVYTVGAQTKLTSQDKIQGCANGQLLESSKTKFYNSLLLVS